MSVTDITSVDALCAILISRGYAFERTASGGGRSGLWLRRSQQPDDAAREHDVQQRRQRLSQQPDDVAKGRHASKPRSHCKRGHPMTGKNRKPTTGGFRCATCARIATRERVRRLRARRRSAANAN